MPEVGTLDQLKNHMMQVVAEIGEEFTKPNDDWEMVALFEDVNGNTYLSPLPNEAFANESTKDILANMLKSFIQSTKIINYAILFNVHGVVRVNKDEMKQILDEGRRVSTYPDSFEMLMLVTGTSGYEKSYQAKINRDGINPPTLDEWEEIPETAGRFSGFNKMIEPIEI